MYKIFGLFLCCVLLFLTEKTHAQDFDIGIRAGLARSKFIGPSEMGVSEKYSLSGGFHFGINLQLNFTEVIGWRTEILYSQLGSSYLMNSDNGAYIFNDILRGIEDVVFHAQSRVTLRHSNAYLLFPQTLHVALGDKFEIFGGGYFGFLLSPVATGTFEFAPDSDLLTEHKFTQGLNFNYFSDPNLFLTRNCPDPSNANVCALIRVNGEDVDVLNVTDSETFWGVGETESRLHSIDYGLITGAAFYLNRGLYLMGRVEYGLRDITRNTVDFSFANVNEDATVQYRDDFDRNLSFQLSLGFRF